MKDVFGPSGKLLCLDKPYNNMQHMDGNIPFFFDFWADIFVHLRLLDNELHVQAINSFYGQLSLLN